MHKPEMNILGSNHTYHKNNSQDFIVIHHTTEMTSFDNTLKWLSDMPWSTKYSRVSCHYLLDENGCIYGLVSPKWDAWHAGRSSGVRHVQRGTEYYTEAVSNLNDKSIGIELYGDGNVHPYSELQYRSLASLVAWLMDKYSIDPRCVVGHEDIAPGRKNDPGRLFNWARLKWDLSHELCC